MLRHRFDKIIGKVLGHEGGYVNDPVDMGGETKFGISKRAYPHLDIRSITLNQAKEIYYRDYWVKAKCGQLTDNMQYIHFDTAVNMGVSRANNFLQQSIGGIAVDGILGRNTLAKVHKASLKKYSIARAKFYTGIVKRRPLQIRFLYGWMKRLISVSLDSTSF